MAFGTFSILRTAGQVLPLALLLGGCQVTQTLDSFGDQLNQINDGLADYGSQQNNPGPKLEPASLPRFGSGDAFVFDSGRGVFVEKSINDDVTWNGGGSDYVYTGTSNFTLPNASWHYKDKDGLRHSGTAVIEGDANGLWPLRVGKQSRLSIHSETASLTGDAPHKYDQWLKCHVPRTETVKTPAGTFDTYVIECSRFINQWWIQTTKWWYAPKIGFYVKRDRSWRGGKRQSEKLEVFGPAPHELPKATRTRLNKTVQAALENNLSGKAKVSRGKDGTDSETIITITPTRTVRTDQGKWCRTYRQKLSVRDRSSVQIQTACRTENGWVTESTVASR